MIDLLKIVLLLVAFRFLVLDAVPMQAQLTTPATVTAFLCCTVMAIAIIGTFILRGKK